MKSVRSAWKHGSSAAVPFADFEKQCVIIFGLLIASSLSTSLRAQENATCGSPEISTQNQNVRNQ